MVDDGARARDLGAGPYRERARLPWRASTTWRPKAVQAEATSKGANDAWVGTAEVSGSYGVWIDVAPSEKERLRGIDRIRWRKLETRELVAGEATVLMELPRGVARRVLALIDRSAMRR